MPTAKRATAFTEGMGVNVHLRTNQYENVPRLKEILAETQIKYIRDGGNYLVIIMRELYAELGVKLLLIAGGPPRNPSTIVDYIKNIGIEKVVGVENPNEPDHFGLTYTATDGVTYNYPESVPKYAADLHAALKADPVTAHLPIIGTTAVYSSDSTNNLDPWVDVANSHPYPGGQLPEEAVEFGSLREAIRAAYKANGANQPLEATESGYYENIKYTGTNPGSKYWITREINNKYGMRRLLYIINRGFQRVYTYELVDKGLGLTNKEDTFGLYYRDSSISPTTYMPKPLALHLSRMMTLLKDTAPEALTFVPDSLDFTFSGDTTAINSSLFQKADGSFYLCVWRGLKSWDMDKHTVINNPTRPLTLTLTSVKANVKIYKPFESLTIKTSFINVSKFTYNVGDNVSVFHIKPL